MPLNQTQSAAYEIRQLKQTPFRRGLSKSNQVDVSQSTPPEGSDLRASNSERAVSAQVPAANDPVYSNSRKIVQLRPMSSAVAPKPSAEQEREIASKLSRSRAAEQMQRNLALPQEYDLSQRRANQINKNSEIQAKIDAIRNISYLPYWVMIFVELFRFFLGFLELIPIAGYAFVLVVSLLAMAGNTMLLLFAHMQDPVKERSTIALRLSAMLGVWFIAAVLPYIKMFIPITLLTALVILLLVKRGHKKEMLRLENKLS